MKADFIKAFIKAQREFETIERNKTGQVGQGKFQYADLAELYNKTKDALWNYGLVCNSHVQVTEEGRNILCLSLMHESGYEVVSRILLPEWEKPTQMGASLTYLKRYLYSSILGIVADEDVEGDQLDKSSQKPEPKLLSDSEVLKLASALMALGSYSNIERLGEYLMKLPRKSLSAQTDLVESCTSDKFVAAYEKWLELNPDKN